MHHGPVFCQSPVRSAAPRLNGALPDPKRSKEIREFVRYGHPLVDIPTRRRDDAEFRTLRKPGWLPTAIVVNVVLPTDERGGRKIRPEETISITPERGGIAQVR